MANPFPFTAGQVLTAAQMNGIGEAWTSFTPVWTATTTNPVLGNGTFVGEYTRVNKLVFARFAFVAGSTTTYGTGDYRFDFPVAAKNLLNFSAILCSGFIFDSSSSEMYEVVASTVSSGSVFRLNAFRNSTQTVSVVGPTVPMTFANGDQMFFTICYEAA